MDEEEGERYKTSEKLNTDSDQCAKDGSAATLERRAAKTSHSNKSAVKATLY